ncbi:hypothetical protein GLAREA_09054 [Glarea lozoyensis ATCC 20868]|uniref:Uncharacterized protein n=1 Tax=Glarea lozoyensis (strain ATCC 20868 / MF5171) TaxID=1116229 RepID=S3DY93_GLAL2|nr:uncharacterized protein GLAREA_09054 [Glarea lozoyensis ATCC 20868]EPE36891.1 hypothetical protein GLAREA_09054 [Glarea lozoyensis ATCC 20868]
MSNSPLRVVIRVCVTDIPANPQERVYRLGCDFAEQILRRPYNNNLRDDCHDAMHFLPNCESENSLRAWFVYDFNVTEPLDKTQVLTISHAVYHATRQGEPWWVRSLRRGKLVS